MAKFCMNCGQPLVDGQPCSCTTTQNVVTSEATQQTINVQPSNNGTVDQISLFKPRVHHNLPV